VVKLEAVEFFLQASDRFAVRVHLGIMAARLFHDLVNDESRIASDLKPFNPKLDHDVETIDKRLVLCCIV